MTTKFNEFYRNAQMEKLGGRTMVLGHWLINYKQITAIEEKQAIRHEVIINNQPRNREMVHMQLAELREKKYELVEGMMTEGINEGRKNELVDEFITFAGRI